MRVGFGGGKVGLEHAADAVEGADGPFELDGVELLDDSLGPRQLLCVDGLEHLSSGRRELDELSATVDGMRSVGDKSGTFQLISDALHALACVADLPSEL